MRRVPYVFEGAHRLGSCCDTVLDVKVITEAERYEGPKVLEMTTKSDKTISNHNRSCFLKFIVKEAFPLEFCFRFLFVVLVIIYVDIIVFVFNGISSTGAALLKSIKL